MADFGIAYQKTMRDEGGYANSSKDGGGETWKGVARVFHPRWPGWHIVDSGKTKLGVTNSIDNYPLWTRITITLKESARLEELTQEFYRVEFWDKFRGVFIEDQSLADEMFDVAVNMSPFRACLFLQNGLNILNSDQRFWPDIAEDGDLGSKTFAALRAIIVKGDLPLLVKVINIKQGCFYLEQLKRPSQEGFARAWLSRVKL